jgi:hypothetical protein
MWLIANWWLYWGRPMQLRVTEDVAQASAARCGALPCRDSAYVQVMIIQD